MLAVDSEQNVAHRCLRGSSNTNQKVPTGHAETGITTTFFPPW